MKQAVHLPVDEHIGKNFINCLLLVWRQVKRQGLGQSRDLLEIILFGLALVLAVAAGHEGHLHLEDEEFTKDRAAPGRLGLCRTLGVVHPLNQFLVAHELVLLPEPVRNGIADLAAIFCNCLIDQALQLLLLDMAVDRINRGHSVIAVTFGDKLVS